jgi:anaerobic magnesium-protoporphyrin IX monomethyl ester cyclase
MRIALIDIDRPMPGTPPVPPLGIAYLAAFLKQHGVDNIELLDLAVASHDEVKSFMLRSHDLIGISVTSHCWQAAVDLSERLKALHPRCTIAVGGPHVDAAMEDVLKCRAVDVAFAGEGERSFQRFVEALLRGKRIDEDTDISNMISRDSNGIRVYPKGTWIEDLDSLPFPDFSQLPLSRYGVYPIMSSRGCPFRCLFCLSSVKWGKRWRSRSAENLVAELHYAYRQGFLQSKTLVFLDDTFNLNKRRVEDYCQLVIKHGLRVDTMVMGVRANLLDSRQAKLMKAAGISRIGIGIESADVEVLEKIGKGQTIEEIRQGIGIARDAGIGITGLFMIGNPGDNMETIRQSIRFARRTKLDDVRFSMALPYPNTQLWKFIEENGRFLCRDYTSHDFLDRHPMFETPDFPIGQRLRAWRMAKRFEYRLLLVQILKSFRKARNWRWQNLRQLCGAVASWAFLK